jgi:hypothetical protein
MASEREIQRLRKWSLCDTAGFERALAQTFPHGEWLATVVLEKFDADLQMLHYHREAQSDHVWQFGEVTARYRLMPGLHLVEILSISQGNPQPVWQAHGDGETNHG